LNRLYLFTGGSDVAAVTSVKNAGSWDWSAKADGTWLLVDPRRQPGGMAASGA